MPRLCIVFKRNDTTYDPAPLCLVIEILNRQCEILVIDYTGVSETVHSVFEMEKLIQVSIMFHVMRDGKIFRWFTTPRRSQALAHGFPSKRGKSLSANSDW